MVCETAGVTPEGVQLDEAVKVLLETREIADAGAVLNVVIGVMHEAEKFPLGVLGIKVEVPPMHNCEGLAVGVKSKEGYTEICVVSSIPVPIVVHPRGRKEFELILKIVV